MVQLALDKPFEFDTLIAGVREASKRILEEADLAFMFGFDDLVREIGPELFDAMRQVVDNLVEEEGIDPAEAWVVVIKETLKASPVVLRESIKTAIKDGFDNSNALLKIEGANAIDGLITGINSRKTAVEIAMREISRLLVSTAVRSLQIRSPSKIFMDIGKNVVDGFRIGLQDSAKTLEGFGLNSLGIPNRHQLIGGSTTNTTNSVANNFNLNVSGSNNVADDARSVLMTAQIIGAT